MKKIYTLLALVLFAFSTSFAQKGYTFVEKSVDKILTGKEHKYVLRQSNNSSKRLMGYASSKDLHAPVTEVDEYCIYNFIKVGETSHIDSTTMENHTFNIYVLRNEANGLYLGNENNMYTTIDRAFQFTAQKAVYSATEEFDDWFIYSKSSNGNTTDKQTDDGLGSWVFCNPYYRYYITFRNGQPSFPSFEYYRSHDAWQVYEVQERVMSAFEKFSNIYNTYMKTEVIPENFPVGNSVGCIPSQELYNEYEKLYLDATNAFDNQDRSDEEYDKLRQDIIEISKKVSDAIIPFVPGYYLLISEYQNTAILDPAESRNPWFYGVLGKSAPDNFHYENANYVWKISETDKKGKYEIQNLKTLRYVGHSRGNALWWKLESKPSLFNINNERGQWFTITNEKNAHLSMSSNSYDPSDNYVRESNDKGRILWKFENINPDTLDALMEPTKQTARNKELKTIYKKAKETYYGYQYSNKITFNGTYMDGAEGLANESNTFSNSTANGEDSKKSNAFDNNLGTYFHAQWKSELAPQEYHWMQIDLGKEVKEIYVKYTQHKPEQSHNQPTRFAIVTPEEGIEPLTEIPWNDTIADCIVENFIPTEYERGSVDSSTVIEKVVLSKPARNIRFVVKETRKNMIRGGGPCWAAAEFRIYDVADCTPDLKYAAIKQEIKDELKNQMDIAYNELAKDSATLTTIEKLQAAINTFWDEYTISDNLTENLENAQMLINNAVEVEAGEEAKTGYFEAGAKAEFQVVIDRIKAETENKVLTRTEIDQFVKDIKTAEEAFYNKFIGIPANGFYQIVCRAGYNEKGEEIVQNDACLISKDANVESGPKWGYKQSEGLDGRLNTLWYVEKSEKGYSFKNLANGLYINNVFEDMTPEEMEVANDSMDIDFRLTRYSKTPKHFQLRPALKGGQVMLALKDQQFLALRNDNNRDVVHYFAMNNAPAQFELVSITDNDFYVEQVFFDVPSNKTQIVTLPFESKLVSTNAGQYAHKVLGINGSYVRLEAYTENDVIPAGCPFIIKTEKSTEDLQDNIIIVETKNTCLQDFVDTKFNYAPYNQNGMISAPSSFELEAGYGFLFNGMVLISSGGEYVYSGTGFFNKSIPTTTEEGSTFMLPIDGKIEGEGTAVENVTIQKNVNTDVYNISGMKVRSNVKMAEATKGLNKGVYIINGQKFIVK